MAMTSLLAPLHNGPHDSVSDLTVSDYFLLLLVVAVLVGIGFVLYRIVKRRREDDEDDD